MNKIFSLKYSNISGGYIAVAEHCRGAKKTGRQKINPGISPLLFFGALLSASPGIASVVSDEIPYSVFRDFAENKGVFQPGAENIEIYNKAGELVGVLDKAPFPDFSSASASSGIAALVAPQYIAGVAHNGGYSSVSFGDSSNNYRLVDRNEYGVQDFHLPRLNKIVTEVVPIPMTTAGIARDTYKNTARFPIFYRVGSGNQYTKTRDGRLRHLQGAYGYLTGGTIGVPGISDHTIVANPGDTFDPINGPLASYGAPGDSGSPLYTYDAQEGRWVLVAVLRSYNGDSGRTNWWVVLPTDFIHAEMAKDSDPAVTFTAGQGALQWTYDSRSNSGSLSQPRSTVQFTMHGQAGNDLNAGKNLLFQTDGSGAGGEILLQNTINQGAGVLTFEDSYRVTPQNNQTWVGGGIIVNSEATLDWQVNGVAGDNLHRLGSGTLYVRGVGINEGGLKVGDGLTLLDQRPDAAGNVRAFSSLNIASGRPTVKLMADGQLDPDTVTWGFRGGVLDLNGHDMAFHTLRMADYGAKVTNSADARAQLSLNYQPLNYLSAVAYPLRGWTDARVGTPGDLYRYENRHTNTVDYFLLNTSGNYGYFPTNQTSNGPWTYLGHDEASARQTLMLNEQRRSQIIHGQFSDNLDIVNLAEPGMIGTTVFDGRVAITGDFSQRGGSLQFQGHPVTHARDFSTGRPPVSADQPDWEARSFALNTLTLTQADFSLARNAVLLGDIQADASRVILNSNRVFVDSRDGEGVTSADTDVSEGQLSAEVVARSEHQGNILLENRSILVAGGLLNGAVTAANSLVALMADSEHTGDIAARDSLLWLVSGAEQLGDLQLSGVAQLTSLGGIVGNLSAAAGAALLEQGSQLQGDVTLTDGATLISRGQTRGNLSADASALTLESGAVQQGDLQLSGGAQLTSQGEIEGRLRADASSALLAQGSLHRGGDIGLSDGATLALAGRNQSAIGAEASLLALGRSAEQRGDIALSQSLLVSGGRSQGALNLSDSGAYFGQASQHRGDLSLLGDDAWLTSLGEIEGRLRAEGSTVLLEQGSQLQGDVTLTDSAALTSRGETRGSLSTDASAITLESGAVQQGDLQLSGGARLTSLGEIEGRLRAESSTVLLEQGSQLLGDITLAGNAALTSRGQTRGILSADASAIALESGALQQGEVRLDRGTTLTSQGGIVGNLHADASTITLESGAVQQGDLQLGGASDLTSLGEIVGSLSVDASSVLLERGSQLQGDVILMDSAALTSRGQTRGNLSADASTITLERSAVQQGDLQLGGASDLTSLGKIVGSLSADASTVLLEWGSRLQGDITLTDSAMLTSQGEIVGRLRADASLALLAQRSLHRDGDIGLSNGATLALVGRNQSAIGAEASLLALGYDAIQRGDIALSQSLLVSWGLNYGALSLSDSGAYFGPASQHKGDLSLLGDDAWLVLLQGGLLWGDVTLTDGAMLTSRGQTMGSLSADASTITLENGSFQLGDLQLSGASDLTSLGEFKGSLSVDASNALLEQGSQLLGDITLAGNAALTSRGQTRGILSVAASAITLENGAEQQGDIRLDNGASLTSQGLTEGLLSADASTITLESGAVQQGDLQLGGASDLTSLGEIEGSLSVDASSVLLEQGSQLLGDITLAGNAALTSRGQTRGILSADASAITLENGAVQQGDLQLSDASDLTSLGEIEGRLSVDASSVLLERGSQLQGDVTLTDGAALTSRGQTRGLLSADASAIALESGALQQGEVRLDKGTTLTSQGGIVGNLSMDASNALLERGSQLQGDVTLAGNAALTSRGQTRGLLSADASIIALESGAVQRGDLQLSGGAQLTSQGEIEGRLRAEGSSALLAQGSLHRGGDIGLSDGATLALAGRNQSAIGAEASLLALGRSAEQRGDVALSQSLLVSGGRSQGTLSLSDSGAYFGQASQHRGDLSLQGDDAWLAVLSGAALRGDLTVDGAGLLRFGTSPAPEIAIAATPPAAGLADYRGRIAAPEARVEMRDTLWRMSGTSTLGSLRVEESLITATDGAFMTLSVDRLHADGAALVLRADAGISDRLVINERLSGGNNTVLVNYLEPTLPEGQLDVSLISAPVGSDRETFTAHRQHMGFSEVMPALITREADSQLEWVLSGFDVTPDSEREEDAASLLSLNYRSFMAEVQYLDKRQLDLRNGPAGTGAWARVLHGAGSAAENYRDRYLHLQLGADRRYGLGDESDLLAGVTFTFTDGRASGDAFSSRSRALGAGLYATALFPSGLFVDLNGKYVHHSTEYQVNLAGLGERKASNHAWYARADVGYRYELGESAFVEPHLELVYGTYSSTRFDWQDQGMAVSLAQPRFTPLLATAGVALGKRVDIGEWQTTLRAGLDYQSALRPAGDTRLRDASGERTIRGERDGRLRYSLGAESRIGDALQLGLEVERSSLGDYNLDYSVQATLRYRF
ncbi:S6 family peptidase [Edwardsiella anguillarum]|uniref:S6 family peptidase n=1 Tax=Edwardsiella anguillarum TaxID=1821960 RepID=UPI004058D7ED